MSTTVDQPTAHGRTEEPASGNSGRGARSGPVLGPLRDSCAFAVVLAGRAYRALLLTLVAVAMLPAAGSWTSYLVRTGSMEPSIHAGDVVIGQPFTTGEKVPVGRVMVFEAPPGSGVGPVLRVHRVVASLGHDTYTTAGDANPTPDAAPLPRENIRSRAIIRVPYVGRPLVWLDHRDYGPLVLWFLLTVVLLHASFRRVDGDPPEGTSWSSRAGRRAAHALRLPRDRQGASLVSRGALALGTVGLVLATPSAASAAFSATTSSGSNTWRVGAAPLQPYTAAVLADAPYAFHRLDEGASPAAADDSGSNRTGTYTSVAAYRQPGALPHNAGYAIGLSGSTGRMVGGGSGLADPTTFSVELWFRTTTSAGGKLVGFENSQLATSSLFDREAFMRTDGRVVFLGGASTNKLLVSPTALNDGAWHHLVVTSVPAGANNQTSAMYVDGALVTSGTTAKASTAYVGWWRVGYGRVPSGNGYPATGNFTGSVDDVAIYRTQLSAARVAAHHAAR